MKKFLAVFLALALCGVLLAGCGETDPYEEPSTEGENYAWVDDDAPMLQFGKPAEEIVAIKTAEGSMSADLRQMIASLKAVVNGKEVRLFTCDLDSDTPIGWLERLGYTETHNVIVMEDAWEVVDYFKDDVNGLGAVLYDTSNMHSLDVACTYAGLNDCLTLSYSIYGELVNRGYDVAVEEDYRGDFADKYEAYEYLYDTLWDQCTHRILIHFNSAEVGHVRSFGMLVQAAFVYLDVAETRDREIMEKFLADMPAGESCIYGWYPAEGRGVELASRYGVWTYAADYLQSVEFFAHETEIVLPEYTESFTQRSDVDDGTVYVAMLVSEGDNLQYVENGLYDICFSSDLLGDFPVSFSISPTMAVMEPELLNWYYEQANDNIGFTTGPSGVGYTYTSVWEDSDALAHFFELTNEYCGIAGIDVVNNWSAVENWASHPLTDEVRSIMNAECTDILTIIDNASTTATSADGLLITNMQVGYLQTSDNVTGVFGDAIDLAVAETEHYGEPSFVWLQGNPWTRTTMQDFYDCYNAIKEQYGDKVEFVRADELARAQRLFYGLPAER